MTKRTDFIINQEVCCCLKVEKTQVMKLDIMPEVENRGDTDFKATRKLRVFNDTPVTSSSSFKQEFLHRLDNITCIAKLFSSPVGSLCHTCGVVRRPSCVVCVHHNYQK